MTICPEKYHMACGIPWFLTQDIGDMFGKYITDDIFLGDLWSKREESGVWNTLYRSVRNVQFKPPVPNPISYKTIYVKYAGYAA